MSTSSDQVMRITDLRLNNGVLEKLAGVRTQNFDDSGKLTSSSAADAWTQVCTLFASVTGTLAADVTMANASNWYDGPSIALTAGTWLLVGQVTVKSAAATAQRVTAQLLNGATAVACGEAAAPSQGSSTAGYVCIPLFAVVVLVGAATCKISCRSTAANSVICRNPGDNSPASNNASQLTGVRLA